MPLVEIRAWSLGAFETNCYVVTTRPQAGAPRDPACWIVDPGEDPAEVIEFIRQERLQPAAILLTHAHADHIAGLREVRAAFPGVPTLLHRAEWDFLDDPQLNLSAFVGMPLSLAPAEGELSDGQTLDLNGARWRVLHTPGHSPGGVTLVCDAAGQAIVGDTLFAGSIGRTDFPTSDPAAMARSLLGTLLSLPDAVRVHPGHGPSTTIGAERRSNPFLQGARAG
ncbi:MAG: MBL fold metallo-hydrolase [Phycisphaerales bacterium]